MTSSSLRCCGVPSSCISFQHVRADCGFSYRCSDGWNELFFAYAHAACKTPRPRGMLAGVTCPASAKIITWPRCGSKEKRIAHNAIVKPNQHGHHLLVRLWVLRRTCFNAASKKEKDITLMANRLSFWKKKSKFKPELRPAQPL